MIPPAEDLDPDRHRWRLMLLLTVSPFLPVVKLLSGSMPCGFCRWDMLRSFQQARKSECFNDQKRSKMMEQSRRDSNKFIFVFLAGELGRLRHSWFSKQTTLAVCVIAKAISSLNCLATTSVDWVVFHGQAGLAWYKCHSKLAMTFPCLEPSPRQICFKILLQIGCWRYDQHSNFYLKCSVVQWVTKLPWNHFFCIS